MSTVKTAKDALISLLEGDADLITFGLKEVVEIFRDKVPAEDHPYIVINPSRNEEISTNVRTPQTLQLYIDIGMAIYDDDNATQLDSLLEFERLVKVAISNDSTLGDEVITVKLLETEYTNQLWPTRMAVMTARIDYRQDYLTRN